MASNVSEQNMGIRKIARSAPPSDRCGQFPLSSQPPPPQPWYIILIIIELKCRSSSNERNFIRQEIRRCLFTNYVIMATTTTYPEECKDRLRRREHWMISSRISSSRRCRPADCGLYCGAHVANLADNESLWHADTAITFSSSAMAKMHHHTLTRWRERRAYICWQTGEVRPQLDCRKCSA